MFPKWKTLNMQLRPTSSLLIQLILLTLSTSLSTSRIHDVHPINSLTDAPIERSSSSSLPSSLTASSKIPPVRQTIELAHLSSLVYYLNDENAHNCTPFNDTLQRYSSEHDSFQTDGADYRCHLYEHDKQDTQVLIVSRTNTTNSRGGGGGPTTVNNNNDDDDDDESIGNYVAVVYAGTDDFRTVLTDGHIFQTPFGPEGANGTYPLSPSDDVRVHGGFNNQVFRDGLMDRVLETVRGVVMGDDGKEGGVGERSGRRRDILTTGHSLGGANSVLCAVALSSHFGEEMVTSVSYGCPKIGNKAWKDFVDSIPNVAVWRLVNLIDLVPRLPTIGYRHVGHTVQLGRKDTRAYWLHEGNLTLGYRGVPRGWSSLAYLLTPVATYQHFLVHYIKYLVENSIPNKERYYINKFESVNDTLIEDDEDYIEDMDDDEKTRIAEEYAQRYFEYMRGERGISNDYNFKIGFGDQFESANATLEIM